MKHIFSLITILLLFSCTTTKKENVEANTIKIDTTRLTSSQIESNLKAKGFKTFSKGA